MIALVREHVEAVKPPRALYVPYPFGSPLGRPLDADYQHRIIGAGLTLVQEVGSPVLVDFEDPHYVEQRGAPAQYSEVSGRVGAEKRSDVDPATETTRVRQYYQRWIEQRDGRTTVGLTGIQPARFRGIIRFLEAFADGDDVDMRERPADVTLGEWIRLCALDLRTMFSEARMAMVDAVTSEEIDLWFWGETSTGYLLQRVKDAMDASGDETIAASAYGVAR